MDVVIFLCMLNAPAAMLQDALHRDDRKHFELAQKTSARLGTGFLWGRVVTEIMETVECLSRTHMTSQFYRPQNLRDNLLVVFKAR